LKLVFITFALCLGLGSSVASATERYTEVWNPPESQFLKGKTRAQQPKMSAVQAKKKRKPVSAVKQVADKVADKAAVTPQPAVPKLVPKQTEPRIPRKIEPNGQIMRV
jgi:hypothetical protein